MKICSNCNREYEDNLNYCSNCGESLSVKLQECFCTNCGKSLGETVDRYCPYCGYQLFSVNHSKNTEQNRIPNDKQLTKLNKSNYLSREYLFSLQGRRSRSEGFITGLILSSLTLGIIILGFLTQSTSIWYLITPLCLIVLWAQIANCVKRVHDFNKSGLWLLGCFLSYLIIGAFIRGALPSIHNIISIIVPNLIYLPNGTNGPNKYGI